MSEELDEETLYIMFQDAETLDEQRAALRAINDYRLKNGITSAKTGNNLRRYRMSRKGK